MDKLSGPGEANPVFSTGQKLSAGRENRKYDGQAEQDFKKIHLTNPV